MNINFLSQMVLLFIVEIRKSSIFNGEVLDRWLSTIYNVYKKSKVTIKSALDFWFYFDRQLSKKCFYNVILFKVDMDIHRLLIISLLT